MATLSRFDTHEVFNQSPPYENVDLFASDIPLKEAVADGMKNLLRHMLEQGPPAEWNCLPVVGNASHSAGSNGAVVKPAVSHS